MFVNSCEQLDAWYSVWLVYNSDDVIAKLLSYLK